MFARRIKRQCIFCGNAVKSWKPYHIQLSDFLVRVDWITSNMDRHGCPHCHSNDRSRHLWLYLDKLGLLDRLTGCSFLHIAPEGMLTEFVVRKIEPALHIRGDLTPRTPDVVKVDIEKIDFADNKFDLIFCNHVIEHVSDPVAGVRELFRVLAPGGRLICQTPYAARLKNTFMDPLICSEEDRIYFYGQGDHVRLFGTDIVDLLHGAGFVGSLRSHDSLLPGVECEKLGVNEFEPFFDFTKPAAA